MHAGERARLKLCLMDEAWRFIQHPKLRAYVEEGLKTWRKKNAAMVLATQAVDDLASATLLRTVVESCPTTLFLANPALDRQQYADLFRLNTVQLEQLATLTPRRQLLLKRDQMSKILTLDVDERRTLSRTHQWIIPSETEVHPTPTSDSDTGRLSRRSSTMRCVVDDDEMALR